MASGLAEWLSLVISEINHGCFDLRQYESHLANTSMTGITDCKSLYDALHSAGSPSEADDKRAVIDWAIIKQRMARTGLSARWCPTQLMISDGMTKDLADPADLLKP